MVKSACGIGEVYMCFNGTGIWGGETLTWIILDQHIILLINIVIVFYVYLIGQNKCFLSVWLSNPSECVHKKNCEDGMNIDDWRAFTSILNMQISPWRPSWL